MNAMKTKVCWIYIRRSDVTDVIVITCCHVGGILSEN